MFSDSGANLKLSGLRHHRRTTNAVVEKTFYISNISDNNKVSL